MDYRYIKQLCTHASEMTLKVVESFLIPYADGQDKLSREAEQKFRPFRHIGRKLSSEWMPPTKTQYIAHRIFRQGGLANRYLVHSALKMMNNEELAYLRNQIRNPWRFCFSEITARPSEHFFEMEDILTGETFLLYSPGTTQILRTSYRNLWFNLMIAFNGACWQSFGPITGYSSFIPDDIFFYATEITRR